MPGAVHIGDNKTYETSASDVVDSEVPIPTVMPKCAGSYDDDWVLYAYHPKYGRLEVHEGVAVVADGLLVYGVSRVRFQSITLPAAERFMVRQLAARP